MPVADALREAVIATARAAAAEILRVYETCFDVEHKADDSPLTAADLAAHRCIVDRLEALTPQIPVLSEESADTIPTLVRRTWSRLWVVDPLDGTREFVKRNGEFTVNIALIEGGEAVLGVVQAPVTGALWHGQRGRGAFRREGGHDLPIRVRTPAKAPLRVAASRARSRRDILCMASLDAVCRTDADLPARARPTERTDEQVRGTERRTQ